MAQPMINKEWTKLYSIPAHPYFTLLKMLTKQSLITKKLKQIAKSNRDTWFANAMIWVRVTRIFILVLMGLG